MSASDMSIERLEALLRGGEPRTLDEKNRSALLAELRAGGLVAPDRLRERVLATAPSVRRRLALPPRRRLVLVVVPVAAALAVGAALVHGALNSGSRSGSRGWLAAGRVYRELPPARTAPKAAEKNLFHRQAHGNAVRGGLDFSAAGNAARPNTADQVAAPLGSLSIPRGRLVHADASLQVAVPSHAALTAATNKATKIVASFGGYAQSVQYQTSRQGYGNAYLDLRVPLAKAQTAIAKLGGLGTLVSQQISTQDLQQQLTQQNTQLGSLRRAIAVYEQALQSGTLSASERVDIQIRLANARHSVTVLRKARGRTVAYGSTADVSLTLTTNPNGIGAVHHGSGTGRLGRMLGSAAGFLGLEGIIVLYALVVLSPVLVLGGLGWLLRRERRRRDERRLLATT